MAKLRLDIDSLQVQSFSTAEKNARRGTVHGASIPTFEAWCTEDPGCSDTTPTNPVTQPAVICNTNAQEVCPEYSGLGCV